MLLAWACCCYNGGMSKSPLDRWYEPAAAGAEPSCVAGLSVAEFDEIADKIAWFSELSVREKYLAWVADMRLAARLSQLRDVNDGA